MSISTQTAVLYIHGKNGSAQEAEHYIPFFPGCFVTGLNYTSVMPWDAAEEIRLEVERLRQSYHELILIANSIGAFFAMQSDIQPLLSRAFFISPITDMNKLLCDMMVAANITENQLREQGEIATSFGETLSWAYLTYVRTHPIAWHVPTEVLYGGKDHLMSPATISSFCHQSDAVLTVMEQGEHWFHTEEQMAFLDRWLTTGLSTAPNDFLPLARRRCSVRSFLPTPVPEQIVDHILDAGLVAPTACNNQPQKIIVVQSEEGLTRFRRCTECHYHAPLAFIIGYDRTLTWTRPFDQRSSGDIDASIVATHMMLEAASQGIGSTWLMYFKPDAIREEFSLPDHVEPIALLIMGYPAQDFVPAPRHFRSRDRSEMVSFE